MAYGGSVGSIAGNIGLLSGGFDITPSDTIDLTRPARGICVEVTGKVKLKLGNGDVGTWPLAGGVVHPLVVLRVYQTGTDAEVLAGLIKGGK